MHAERDLQPVPRSISRKVTQTEMEPDDGGTVLGVDDDDPGPPAYSEENRECCPPQVFTSVLLGLLACVLVTGGVFLAFHKWDHTWLLVSAVGVLLMTIGTALHCCSSSQQERKGHRCKGGCGMNRTKPDAINGGNGALLTEQLLPLSNARSVSQLSLNMVPGYFPPLVYPSGPPYGLEQHSAVVQNISKLVQHQQQLHLQSPTSTQSDAKSFILLPLPVDTNATNIKNIVAAVCQLDTNTPDANNGSQPTDSSSGATETSVVSREDDNSNVPATPVDTSQPSTSSHPVLKNAEVQTCCEWTQPGNSELKSSHDASTATACESPEVLSTAQSSTPNTACQTVESEVQRTVNTDASVSSVQVTSVPLQVTEGQDNSTCETSCDNISDDAVANVSSDIPRTLSQNDIPLDSSHQPTTSSSAVEGIDRELAQTPLPEHSLAGVDFDSPQDSVDDNQTAVVLLDTGGNNSVQDIAENSANSELPSTSDVQVTTESPAPLNPHVEDAVDSSLENIADTSSDIEAELFDRSSPPPSYDDVTQETSASGSLNAFALAYGTM